MTSIDTEFTLQVSANLPSVYTAAHFFSGIPIVKTIYIKGLPACFEGDISLSVNGQCGNRQIIDFQLDIPDFFAGEVIPDDSDMLLADLEKHKILPDASFMNELTINASMRLKISVFAGGRSASTVHDIKISPFGHVCPEMPPELICTYVLPDCEFAAKAERRLSAHAKKAAEKHPMPAPKPLLYAEAIASIMLSAKLTYSAIHREMLDGDCIIRDPDTLVSSNKRSVSMTEAALLYCSCAERCGLHPGIIFLRKGAGSVKVLISIGLSDYHAGSPVSESISELRERILDKDIFVFDVLGLLGTEDTNFARNVTDTTNLVLKSSSTLVFSVDIYTSRLYGVSSLRPFDGAVAKNIYGGYESISDAIKRMDKNADNVSIYGYSPYRCTSLGLCVSIDDLVRGKEYTICPLDSDVITGEQDAFLSFSGFVRGNISEVPRNNTETALFESRVHELREKVHAGPAKGCIYAYPTKYMLSGEKLYAERIRNETAYDAAKLCETIKLDALHNGGSALYITAGMVRITEDGASYYAPCAYIPCKIVSDGGVIKLRYGTGKTIYNRSLRNYAEKITGMSFANIRSIISEEISADTARISDDLTLCLEAFKYICASKPELLHYSEDTVVSVFDLSYTLMRECLERADGKLFEKYLESGKYVNSEQSSQIYGRYESTLPFDCPQDVRGAVKAAENDSIVISGAHGTGKKKAVGNIIARTALSGGDILVASKYVESLKSLYRTMEDAGISELCLLADNEADTKKRILAHLEKIASEPDYPLSGVEGDIALTEHFLNNYADDIYSEFGFGYSLYDCINEYCKCELLCDDAPITLSLDIRDLSKDNAARILDLSQKLYESSKGISELCRKGNSDISEYLRYIKSTTVISDSVCGLFSEAAKQVKLFSEKSVYARNCLGLTEKDIPDVRTMTALGEFLELIMSSGIDELPEELLSGSTYRTAKNIEQACCVIDELNSVNAELTLVSDRIASISCTELYIRWRDAENNPFVRNSITHEIKKYLPPKTKPTPAQTGELLEKLSKREDLEKELSHIAPSANDSLGSLWKGSRTDTEKARRIAAFAVSADICLKKLFRNGKDTSPELRGGLSRLIFALSQDKTANSDFILAVSAFRKLSDEKNGLIDRLSEILCSDFYEFRFSDGLLGEKGIALMLESFCDNFRPLAALHELNTLKKEAVSLGLCDIVGYLENENISESTGVLIRKSIFNAFAQYIISSKISLGTETGTETETFAEKCRKYIHLYESEKKLARFNLLSIHRKRFRDNTSDDEIKNNLYSFREALSCDRTTLYDILSEHRAVIKLLYSAILVPSSVAYMLESYPGTLVLTDCEKTDAAEYLPLCASFDKCIFIASPFEKPGCLMSSLPLGIPTFDLTRILCEKNGRIAEFTERMFANYVNCYYRQRSSESVSFIKCPGGLYDKNAKTNRIEAVQVCETALAAGREHGIDNVGIIAMTPGQTFEISCTLELLANKYSDERIAGIPVRYIGSMGDFSMDCIVLSTTFGKNIYSVTRSFGAADDISRLHCGYPAIMAELLCCGKYLYVVSSVEAQDIMTDGLCKGALCIASLISFAKHGTVPVKYTAKEPKEQPCDSIVYIRQRLAQALPSSVVRCKGGIVSYGDRALICENGYIRDIYERIVLPAAEAKARGYKTDFSCICDIPSKETLIYPEDISEK